MTCNAAKQRAGAADDNHERLCFKHDEKWLAALRTTRSGNGGQAPRTNEQLQSAVAQQRKTTNDSVYKQWTMTSIVAKQRAGAAQQWTMTSSCWAATKSKKLQTLYFGPKLFFHLLKSITLDNFMQDHDILNVFGNHRLHRERE
jgi:hypothetical protein